MKQPTAARSSARAEAGTGSVGARPAPVDHGPIVHVTTVPVTLHFLTGQASFIGRHGFAVHAISSPGAHLASFAHKERVRVHSVAMTRRITPLRDLRALWDMVRELRRIRPRIVHAHTPKGGLLGMISAWIVRAPVRVYTMHGSPVVTAQGLRRRLLLWAERLSCSLAHRVLAVSESTRITAVVERLCRPEKIKVLLRGSVNGVDARGRFRPQGESVRLGARREHGIPPDALVIGFVGRLAREKGVVELAGAWRALSPGLTRLHLLVVGALEEEDPLPAEVISALRSDPRVHLTGPDWNTPRLFAAMDVLALPSYREGFPVVALEAAAMALPIVATRVPGCVDAVQDGITGMLVAPRDPAALADALERYLSDPALRARHGQAARRRALTELRPEEIWEAVLAEYRSLLSLRAGSA